MGILPRSPRQTLDEALRDLTLERSKADDRYVEHCQGMEDAWADARECDRLINELLDRRNAATR